MGVGLAVQFVVIVLDGLSFGIDYGFKVPFRIIRRVTVHKVSRRFVLDVAGFSIH